MAVNSLANSARHLIVRCCKYTCTIRLVVIVGNSWVCRAQRSENGPELVRYVIQVEVRGTIWSRRSPVLPPGGEGGRSFSFRFPPLVTIHDERSSISRSWGRSGWKVDNESRDRDYWSRFFPRYWFLEWIGLMSSVMSLATRFHRGLASRKTGPWGCPLLESVERLILVLFHRFYGI